MNKQLTAPTAKPIGICCDHAGFALKQLVVEALKAAQIEVNDYGTFSEESCDYADFAHKLGYAIEEGVCDVGIAICGSGNGINMTMNKHQSVRAALCWQKELARLARSHNNANVLTLPSRFISTDEAFEAIRSFFDTPFEGGRHQFRIDKIPLK